MQILNDDVVFSAPNVSAIHISTGKASDGPNISKKAKLLGSISDAQRLIKVPFRIVTGTPLSLSEACRPAEVGQYLKNGKGSFTARPIFRGQDLSVLTTKEGCTVDFHSSEPFRIPKDVVSFLRSRTRLHKQFLEGDEVRLGCRYVTIPGMDHHLDIYQDSIVRHGRILLKERVRTNVGKPIEYRPFLLDTSKLDASEAFRRETRRVLTETARVNGFLLAEVEALLWFPTGSQMTGVHQTVRVDVTAADLASYK